MKTSEIVVFVATILSAGWFAAFVTQALKRVTWPSWVRLIISALVALLVTLATLYLTGELSAFVNLWRAGMVTAESIIVFGTLIFTAAQAWYRLNFKGTEWAESLARWPSKGE